MGPEKVNVVNFYRLHGIDISQFEIVWDQELFNSIGLYNMPHDIYQWGGHISQQLIKLLALDYYNSDKILISCADTFCTKPKEFFCNERPRPWIVNNPFLNNQFKEFYEYLTGIKQVHHWSFISESMPVKRVHWDSFKLHIEQRFQLPWFDALMKCLLEQDQSKPMPISEYEILGNWQLHQDNKIELDEQFPYKINEFPKRKHQEWDYYNAVGVNPGYLTFDNVNQFVLQCHNGSILES